MVGWTGSLTEATRAPRLKAAALPALTGAETRMEEATADIVIDSCGDVREGACVGGQWRQG